MTFFCGKRKEQLDEPCAWCDDCPGDLAPLVSFLALDADQVTPELEAALAGDGWERI